jgi:hypothetical protein
MTARYAEDTAVSSDRSISEIRATLRRYGAGGFTFGEQGQRALVGFEMSGKLVRFELRFPDPSGPSFTRTPTGKTRTETAAREAWEQAIRQSWRALALVVKAKLEAVAAGIATFEEEFLAYLVLPGGQTVGARALPEVEAAYRSGAAPRLLLGAATEAGS